MEIHFQLNFKLIVQIWESYILVMRCAIWYQTLKNGVRMVGQNVALTSYYVFEWLSQESVSLHPFDLFDI